MAYNFVKDEGSPYARIFAIGEAPGEEEDRGKRPFIGPAGKLLTRMWNEVGLTRQDVYLANVLQTRPNDRNDFTMVHPAELQVAVESLHERIAAHPGVQILVPQGNTALQALLGFQGITRHRGYYYNYTDLNGRQLTVIPAIHPAAMLWQAKRQDTTSIFDVETKGQRSWIVRTIKDWKRIRNESLDPQPLLKRTQYIFPNIEDLEWLVNFIEQLGPDDPLAIDVETPRKKIPGEGKRFTWGSPFLACVGFACDPKWSMTIPTTLAYWKSKAMLARVWQLLIRIFLSRSAKVTQNGLFDWFHIYNNFGVEPVNWRWDTLAMDHQRDPIESHSLEFQASIHIRTQYWKDENKEADEITAVAYGDAARFYTYNGKDSHHTLEIQLCHAGVIDHAWYKAHYEHLFMPLLSMMLHGIRVNDQRRRLRLAHLTAQAITQRAGLTTMAGEDLYGPAGGLSPKKLQRFLYETLGLPKQTVYDHKKKQSKVTTKEVAIRRLAIRYPEKFGPASELILGSRRVSKQKEFYDDSLCDPDGYTRCQYGLTETMRLRSWANPMRRGRNHQNFDHQCRDHLIPDPGQIWLEPDASQVESRICYAMTGDDYLVQLARLPPWLYDDHTTNASQMLGIPFDQVGYIERQVGKIGAHAAQRDVKGATLADTFLKELGIVRTPQECQRYIDYYFENGHMPIKTTFMREVRNRMIADKKLVNSWGFEWTIAYEPLDDKLFRRGYSFYMQSENGMNTNYLALVPTYYWLQANGMKSTIVCQTHDSLGFSAEPSEVYAIMRQVRSTWEVEREYWGTKLTVPICWKLGTAMGKTLTEFKKFPTEQQVQEAVDRCLGSSA